MNHSGRALRISVLVAGLAVALAAGRAEAAGTGALQDGLRAARAAQAAWLAKAEAAIVIGGVALYRHRHAVAGATLGCVAGSIAATTLVVGAGLATGGGALAGSAPALALGCGLGALGGAALGQPLDDIHDEP